MNNYLETKKEQVKYWSKVSSLILASLPLIYELRKKEDNLAERLASESLTAALSIGVTSYYVISSIFWPESLSVGNWLLLAFCSVASFMHMKGVVGKLLEKNLKK